MSFFVLKYPWLTMDKKSYYTYQNYGTVFILTKILWNAFINMLHNIKAGFQQVMSI